MADKTISDLDAYVPPLTGTEIVPISKSGSTVRATLGDVAAFATGTASLSSETPVLVDQFVFSDQDDGGARKKAILAQFPYQVAPGGAVTLAGSVARTLNERLSEAVSVKDFGAVGDGVADDAPAFAAALTQSDSVGVPAGTYRLDSPILVSGPKALVGAGWGLVTLAPTHADFAIKTAPASGTITNSTISDMRINIPPAGAGIEARGHGVTIRDVRMFGGDAAKWAIDMVDANEALISRALLGQIDDLGITCNGLRWRNSDPANKIINYGDSRVEGLYIKLGAANTTGIHLLGENRNLINFIQHESITIVASDTGTTPYAGTVGVRVTSGARNKFDGVGFEAVETAVIEESLYTGQGECVGNKWGHVYTQNCVTEYQDSNATLARSVRQRTFSPENDNFPFQVGAKTFADGDMMVPRGLWFEAFNTGEPSVRIVPSSTSAGVVRIDDGADDGGLEVVVAGGNPQIQPIENGAGADFYVGKNGIHAVTLQPCMRLFALNAEPGGSKDGLLARADGVGWDPGGGAGLYFNTGGAWVKLHA